MLIHSFPAAGDAAAKETIMMSYKEAISKLTDDELIIALNVYYNCTLDLTDPDWRTTVLKYVREDWALEVDDETGNVKILGEEFRSFFGEFILFDYKP